jgi:glycine cleavage system aminomethyltransferase T
MSTNTESLEALLETADSPVEMLRSSRLGRFDFPVNPEEYANWREEQRAWREACTLFDMSHHMTDLWVEGPDAIDLLSDLGVNDFGGFGVHDAKQFVACNPDGYLIGDAILTHLGSEPDRYNLVGTPVVPNWVQYHAETGDYDVTVERDENSAFRSGPPEIFRYQIQGPNALDVLDEAAAAGIPEVAFFSVGEFTIAGRDVRGLRHGMTGEPGFELFGPWEHADDVRETLLEAGASHGLRRKGTAAYSVSHLESGWLALPLPAVHEHDELRGYRRWLDARTIEAGSVGGSFVADEVTDYYLRPGEVGYGRLVDLDHEFIGRDAIAVRDEPTRTKVTLDWDRTDVTAAFGTLFEDDTPARYLDLPTVWYSTFPYDTVSCDGADIGVSKSCGYLYNERAILSLAVLDDEFADPGTEVTVTWGQPDQSPLSAVESHVQTEIQATVRPAPYRHREK